MTEINTLTATPRRRPRTLWLIAAAVVAGAVFTAGIGIGAYLWSQRPTALERNDPAGAVACQQLHDWLAGKDTDPDTGKPYTRLIFALAVAKPAALSTTPGIKATAGEDFMDTDSGKLLKTYGGPDTFRAAKLPQLREACVAAGEKMPAYREPS